jgi:hypothetical protein
MHGRLPPQNLLGQGRQVEADPQAIGVDEPTAGLQDRELRGPSQAKNGFPVDAVAMVGRPPPQLLQELLGDLLDREVGHACALLAPERLRSAEIFVAAASPEPLRASFVPNVAFGPPDGDPGRLRLLPEVSKPDFATLVPEGRGPGPRMDRSSTTDVALIVGVRKKPKSRESGERA